MLKYLNNLVTVRQNNQANNIAACNCKCNCNKSISNINDSPSTLASPSFKPRSEFNDTANIKCRPILPLKAKLVKLMLSSGSINKTNINSESDIIKNPKQCVYLDPTDDRYQRDELDENKSLRESELENNFYFSQNRRLSSSNGSASLVISETCGFNRRGEELSVSQKKSLQSNFSSKKSVKSKHTASNQHQPALDFVFDSNDLEYYYKNYSKSNSKDHHNHDTSQTQNHPRQEETSHLEDKEHFHSHSTSKSENSIEFEDTVNSTHSIRKQKSNRTFSSSSGISSLINNDAKFDLEKIRYFFKTNLNINKLIRKKLAESRLKNRKNFDKNEEIERVERSNCLLNSNNKPIVRMTAQMASFLKLTLVGNGGVGKSCLILQYMYGDFVEEYEPTKADAYRRTITLQGDEVQIDILDTAGQEDYPAVRDGYLKHGDGFLLVFDLTTRETFEAVKEHRENVLRVKAEDPNLPIILIGNKSDLKSDRKISLEEAQSLAARWNMPYIETSAKTRENVDKAFSEIFVKIKDLKTLRRQNPTQFPAPPAAKLTQEEEKAIREDSMKKRIKKFYQNFKKKCLIS